MYEYTATNIRCIDGDTIECLTDLGHNVHIQQKYRLYGINAPEKNRKETREAGVASMMHLAQLLDTTQPIVIQTIQDKTEKYGRYLAKLWVAGENINQRMVADGFAVPYMVD